MNKELSVMSNVTKWSVFKIQSHIYNINKQCCERIPSATLFTYSHQEIPSDEIS